jgi:cysteine desulfurase
VLEPLRSLADEGFRLSLAPVGRDGRLDVEGTLALIEERTVLLSVMHVQNETGAVFPIEAVAHRAKAKRPGLVVHSDGAQAFGKLAPPSRVIDLYTVSAHKAHGPQGTGALAIAKGTRLVPLLVGGGQESGSRAGTENLPAIVGFAAAALAAGVAGTGVPPAFLDRASALRERFLRGLAGLEAVVNSPEDGLATTIHASFPGAAAEPLLHALEARGVLASSGSACSSRKRSQGKSHVLEAMGLEEELKASALRFSFSRETSTDDVDHALVALAAALVEVRQSVGSHRGSRR